MKDLNFSELMQIYQEGNRESGLDQWPDEPQDRQLELAEQDFAAYLRDDFFATAGAVYYIWEDCGAYRSALRLEPYRDGWLLEALETHPRYRRSGYAEMLIRQVQKLGKYPVIYSHVHKKNAASLAIHKKCGFCRISEQARYIDGSFNSRCCTMAYRENPI